MCGCNKDIKDASHLKIYIIMAKYKAKKDIIIIRDGVRFVLRKSSEEQLSYLYEDLGLTSYVEKISTRKPKNEKAAKVSTKKESSKETSTDENTDE
tara:strand:+ start:194 stop:481 length:288 start_codon:yes stop_codon:yes gene_type:complete